MGTNYIAPTWRMPENTNKDKLSNYSIDTAGTNGINCGSMADLFGTASVTYNTSYSIWVKPEFDYNTGTYQTFFGNYASGNNAVLLYYQIANDKWRFLVGDGSGFEFVESNVITSNVELGKGEWQHHCVVFDTVNNNAYYYINNQQINSSTSITKKIATTGNFYIGKKWDLSTGTFTGEVSQACVFDYDLSEDQRTYLYNLNNPMAISGAEPIAYWPLGDNSNPTALAGYPNISVGADSVFDFNSSFIDPGSVDLGVNGSVAMWFNPEVGSVTDYVLLGEGSQGFDYVIRRQSGAFYIWIGGTFYNFALGNNIVDGNWNFLVVTKSAGDVNVYLKNSNGEFSGSHTNAGWTSASFKFDRIGGRTINPINLPFDGELSNFQAWDTTLVNTEITTLYNNGSPIQTLANIPQNSNLKAWYKLNQYDSYWDLGGNGKWTFNNAAIN